MKKLNCLLFAVSFTAITPAIAAKYSPTDAVWVGKTCEDHSSNAFNCFQYVTDIADAYFVLNPNCPRPEGASFMDMYEKIRLKLAEAARQNQTEVAAASVVLNTLSELNPCPSAPIAAEAKAKNCGDLFTVLNNQWANNYVKQAALEAARNRGCLN